MASPPSQRMGLGRATRLTPAAFEMAAIQIPLSRTPLQLMQAILGLCPGGPVGKVMAKRGRLLLPRYMTAERVVIERRSPGFPTGRIIVTLSADDSGTLLTIHPGAFPLVVLMSLGVIAVVAFIVGKVVGAAAGIVVGALLAVLETVRWKKGMAAVNKDAEWLANELQRRDGSRS